MYLLRADATNSDQIHTHLAGGRRDASGAIGLSGFAWAGMDRLEPVAASPASPKWMAYVSAWQP